MQTADSEAGDKGFRAGLMFALVAERLSLFYEHGQWLKEAQGASLAADWLARANHRLPARREAGKDFGKTSARDSAAPSAPPSPRLSTRQLRAISAASDEMARQIAGSLSREAGLYTAHEMNESLDPNYQSELAHALMDECARLLDGLEGLDPD